MTLDQTRSDTLVFGPPAYERYFVPAIGRPIAEDLVAAAQLRSGEQVLDIACGTGIVARLAARRVFPGGAVSGADINPGMIAEAERACRDIPGIDWREADAAALPMPDNSFDVVFCQMGLQFFSAKLAPLKEMRRVLRPGGRVLVNTPGPIPDLFAVIRDAVARHVHPKAAGFLDAVFSLHDPDEYIELLRSAGFGHSDVGRAEKILALPSPGEFLWQYLQSTPIGADVATETDKGTRAALETDVRNGLRRFETGRGMKLQVGLTTAAAQK